MNFLFLDLFHEFIFLVFPAIQFDDVLVIHSLLPKKFSMIRP